MGKSRENSNEVRNKNALSTRRDLGETDDPSSWGKPLETVSQFCYMQLPNEVYLYAE